MIVIYAEKPDMGSKIAAALDCIHLHSGKTVHFDQLLKHEAEIKSQRAKDGYFEIKYRNQKTIVTWGFGHMCELKQAKDINKDYQNWENIPLPFIPESYDLKLITNSDKNFQKRLSSQYRLLKDLFFKADEIICATDDDREGDLIFDYLYSYMNCKTKFTRALFNKQSEEEFKKAFLPANLKSSAQRQSIINAGRARGIGDFIVGAGPTVALSLKYPGNGVLSVGRVQTATLNLIVEREKEIRNFKPKEYFVVSATYHHANGDYKATHTKGRFDTKEQAEQVLNKCLESDKTGTVTKIEKTEQTRKKPFLYSLQSLQMDANKKYGMSLEATLQTAQSLYEGGFTSYPRTDSMHLPEDMGNEIENVLKSLKKNGEYSSLIPDSFTLNKKDKRYFDNSKVESHYAIVPTTKAADKLTGNEKKVYDLIAKSVICMIYPDAVMGKTVIHTETAGEDFVTKGTSVIKPGFLQVTGVPKDADLPTVKDGDVSQGDFNLETKYTEPPKRYTDGSLLNAMITCGKLIEDEELKELMSHGPGGKPIGLGRPSTQANIVQTLETREYIEKKGKTIFPTNKGMSLIEVLPVEDLKSPVMTAQWEKRLDDIEKGADTFDDFVYDLEEHVRKWTNMITEAEPEQAKGLSGGSFKCPVCGKPLIKVSNGYICSGMREDTCKFGIYNRIAGKLIKEAQFRDLFYNGETEVIKGFKSKDGKSFDAKLRIIDKEVKFEFPDNIRNDLICPKCGRPMKKQSWGYACAGYPDCKFAVGKIAGKMLPESQVKKLLTERKTDLITGFTSKNGKNFDAFLILTDDLELKFEFPTSDDYATDINCPVCGNTMQKQSWGYSCSTYPECKFNIGKIAGKMLPESQVKKLLGEGKTDLINGFKSKSGKNFDAYLTMSDDHKIQFEFPSHDDYMTDMACPICGNLLKRQSWGFSCSGYPSCNFMIGKIAEKKITEAQVRKLIKERRTDLITGFKSKSGKTFDAYLTLNDDGKINFVFPEKSSASETNLKCPNCGKPLRRMRGLYGCTGYPDCNFIIGKVLNKTLTEEQINILLNGNEVFLQGLKGKSGKEFEAFVYLEDGGEGKEIRFRFLDK